MSERLKAELYDLNNEMEKAAEVQHERWMKYQKLLTESTKAHQHYVDGSYYIEELAREIKKVEGQLNESL